MPNCIILRGLPGSGKSSIAKLFGYHIVSADSYFYNDGVYLFDRKKLGSAHRQCYQSFVEAVTNGYNVVVDNTNTTKREYADYEAYAKDKGHGVAILTVETDLTDEELAKRNVHGVPVETIRRMRERMKSHV